jgi:hypothetical protein
LILNSILKSSPLVRSWLRAWRCSTVPCSGDCHVWHKETNLNKPWILSGVIEAHKKNLRVCDLLPG